MGGRRQDREKSLEALERQGGLREGSAAAAHREIGVPEADLYGVATFYSLLADPEAGVRVCQGLSCRLAGSEERLEALQQSGAAVGCSCLGRCDLAPAEWSPEEEAPTPVPGLSPSSPDFAIDLRAVDRPAYAALELTRDRSREAIFDSLESAELTGRGGAGFPAHIKWRAVAAQAETERYVVLNADEGEPGTFKDREILLRRPQLVVEGLEIAAHCLGAADIYAYVRGEFGRVKESLMRAVEAAQSRSAIGEVRWHFVDGHGAYICGEETALLEALEGKRGMPRLKPPYPVEAGFRGKPTLVQNVETIACVPAIVERGGAWFRHAGRTEAGSKLYCLSGHVARPGVYEAPMGVSLSELMELAGGGVGELKAFSPGGASSGFLPASDRDRPLDFASLREAGSMLGSAGIVILNDSVDMVDAALAQALFFEEESCGQCSPCRIGTQIVRRALDAWRRGDPHALDFIDEVAWGMGEASICGLGQAAALPLMSARRHFPAEFSRDAGGGR